MDDQAVLTQAQFRFYEELNDFLPLHRRKVAFQHAFPGRASVKDRIESLGVPHTEVDLIVVDGESVGFDHIVKHGDRIAVYPVFESLDISAINRLRPQPLRINRFVLDQHLGKLARHLRLLGFDTLYCNDYDDATLARTSQADGRILLTRDTGLLKRSQVTRGYFVRATNPLEQIAEVIRRFDLGAAARPFKRCIDCNAAICALAPGERMEEIPEGVRRRYRRFWRCPGCQRIYWRGSHHERLSAMVATLLGDREDATDDRRKRK